MASRNTTYPDDDEAFSVVQPHRAVRIGGRVFPAVRTAGHESIGHTAILPGENGSLIGVSHYHDPEGHVFDITGPAEGWSESEPTWAHAGVYYNAAKVRSIVEQTQAAHLPPDVIDVNQRAMKMMVEQDK